MLSDTTLDVFDSVVEPADFPEVEGGGLYVIWLSEEDEPHYYGGRTTCFQRRWRNHLRDLKRGTHQNARMQNTYDKYGVFVPEVLEAEAEIHSDLPDAEQEWLDEHVGSHRCVNISDSAYGGAGSSQIGRKNTPETLAKMRAAAKRRIKEHGSPSHGAETRALISEQQQGRVWLTRGGENTRAKPEDVDALLAEGWERGVTQREDLVRVKQAWITNGDEVRMIPESEVGVMLAAGWERGRVPLSKRKPPTYSYQKVENPKSNHKGTVWVRRRDPAARGGWDARRVSSEEVGTLLAEGWERGMRPASQSRKSKVRSSWADPARREAARQRARNQVNATRSTVWVNDGEINRRVSPEEAEALMAGGWVRGLLKSRS